MQQLFSTEDIPEHRKFRTWMEVWRERFISMEARPTGDGPFHAKLEGTAIGGLRISRSIYSGQVSEVTPQTVRRHNKHHTLALLLRLSGTAKNSQYDRTSLQGAGDMVILDGNRPSAAEMAADTSTILIELPRERLESPLGSAALFAGLTLTANMPGVCLVRTYLNELIRVGGDLAPDAAARMAQIGIDLIVASVAEQLTQDAPKSLQGTVIVQRAKAYIEANLSDPTLDPPQLAMVLGISLRYLQQLFHEREQQVADWIWRRRLETAAPRLADPGYAHVPIGVLAYGCGFISQAHFSRRFKDAFGMSPGNYRRSNLMPKPNATV